MVGIRMILKNEEVLFFIFSIQGLSMTKRIRNTVFPPWSTLSQRLKRRVESYIIYKRPYFVCSHIPDHPLRVTEKATHGKLVGPTLSTPKGDKYYNQYRPLCEVCHRDHCKVVRTLQGLGKVVPSASQEGKHF